MKWYSDSLLKHGERILAIASQVFGQRTKSTRQINICPESDYIYNDSYIRNPRNSDVYFTDMWVTTTPTSNVTHSSSTTTPYNYDEEMMKDFSYFENHLMKNTKKVSSAASLDPNALDEDLVVLEAQTGSFSFRKVVSNDSVAFNNFSETITKDEYFSNSSRGSTEEDYYYDHNYQNQNIFKNDTSSSSTSTSINYYQERRIQNNPLQQQQQQFNSTSSSSDHGCFHSDIFKRLFAGILGNSSSSSNNNCCNNNYNNDDNNNKTSVDSCDDKSVVVNISIKIAGIHWWYMTQSHAAEMTAGYYNTKEHCGYTDIINLCSRYNANLILTCVEMCDEQHPEYARCSPRRLLHQIQEIASKLNVRLSGENALPIFYGISGGIDVKGLSRIVRNTKNQDEEEKRQILKLNQYKNAKLNVCKNGSYPSMFLFTFLRLGPEMIYNEIHRDLWRKFMKEMQM